MTHTHGGGATIGLLKAIASMPYLPYYLEILSRDMHFLLGHSISSYSIDFNPSWP